MRLLTIFIIAVCFSSCSSELIDSQEPESQIKEVVLDKGQKLRLLSENVDDETLDSFLSQVTTQLQEPADTNLQQEYFKSNEIEFLPFPWWKGSYYWANTTNKNITYQTYSISYQNVLFPDQVMLLLVYWNIDKSNPVKHFYKWQYSADYGKGWKMTCVRAQLIGPDGSISKNDIIIEEEIRVFEKHMTCVFFPEPDLSLDWSVGR